MSPERNSSEGDFSFEIVALMQDTSVVSFSAVESISFPFLISVLIATEDEIPSFDDLIGSESLLTIFSNDAGEGGNRYFHGVVRRFEFTGMAGDSFLYEAEVVPSLDFLSLGKELSHLSGQEHEGDRHHSFGRSGNLFRYLSFCPR